MIKQADEKVISIVILSPSVVILNEVKNLRINSAKNLGFIQISYLRDSSSPPAPQNDVSRDYFSILLEGVDDQRASKEWR